MIEILKAAGLTGQDLADIKTIIRAFPEIKQVKLFGSRAEGHHQAMSDVDLVVYGLAEADFSTVQALQIAFENSQFPYFVDIVNYTAINDSDFRQRVDKYGIDLQI